MIFVSCIFFLLSGLSNSIMDTLKDHFSVSIFKHFNVQFWNPEISWYNKYKNGKVSEGFVKWRFMYRGVWIYFNKPHAISDAWHIFKLLMLCFIFLAAVFYVKIFVWWIDFLIFGVCWLLGFVPFYDKILKAKN